MSQPLARKQVPSGFVAKQKGPGPDRASVAAGEYNIWNNRWTKKRDRDEPWHQKAKTRCIPVGFSPNACLRTSTCRRKTAEPRRRAAINTSVTTGRKGSASKALRAPSIIACRPLKTRRSLRLCGMSLVGSDSHETAKCVCCSGCPAE